MPELTNTTRYAAIWTVSPLLADWLERLPDITTLATINEEAEKMAGEWKMCSATEEGRSADSGASSCPECVRHMLDTNPLYAQFDGFILGNYGADYVLPEEMDLFIEKLRGHIARLVEVFGGGVPISHLQTLTAFP